MIYESDDQRVSNQKKFTKTKSVIEIGMQ
jgi:hypothetical protein